MLGGSRLLLTLGFFSRMCQMESYFPLVIKKEVQKHAQKVNVMCLMPKEGASGVYVVDPQYNGETGDEKNDRALCKLIFDARPINGDVWRKITGGHGDDLDAWHVVKDGS